MNNKQRGKVDIVVGGSFGDEAKGSVAAWLITNQGHKLPHYDFTIRVGGYNAEHRFSHAGKQYMCRVLPCGLIEKSIDLYLGAGHLFSVEALNKEVKEMGIDPGRIFIDGNAGIVTEEHMSQSKNADRSKRGGTTGRGAGKAAAHKVLRDGRFLVAHNCPELCSKYHVTNIASLIHQRLSAGEHGLLEGSQGALISLNHGYYPFCCGKDVTPAGVIVEAGVAIQDVGEIFAVYRSYPMRVPGESGPTGGAEISWTQLERRIGGLPESVKRQTQADGTKGEYERIFEWDWSDFRKSLILCAPTKMALTFADWLNPKDGGVQKWEDLTDNTTRHVVQMEQEAMVLLGRPVPVVLIRTGAEEQDAIVRA